MFKTKHEMHRMRSTWVLSTHVYYSKITFSVMLNVFVTDVAVAIPVTTAVVVVYVVLLLQKCLENFWADISTNYLIYFALFCVRMWKVSEFLIQVTNKITTITHNMHNIKHIHLVKFEYGKFFSIFSCGVIKMSDENEVARVKTQIMNSSCSNLILFLCMNYFDGCI